MEQASFSKESASTASNLEDTEGGHAQQTNVSHASETSDKSSESKGVSPKEATKAEVQGSSQLLRL